MDQNQTISEADIEEKSKLIEQENIENGTHIETNKDKKEMNQENELEAADSNIDQNEEDPLKREEEEKKRQRAIKFGLDQEETNQQKSALSEYEKKKLERANRFKNELEEDKKEKQQNKEQVAKKQIKKQKIIPLDEKDLEKINQRIQRFGSINMKIDPKKFSKNLCERNDIEINDASEIRLDTLHVYGVDFVSEQQILKYFESYKPQKIE